MPPLRFSLHEHANMGWGELQIWGCSLSYQVLAFGFRGGSLGMAGCIFWVDGFTVSHVKTSLDRQVRMLKPLGYHLIWYGAGNAVYVHKTAKRRLGHLACSERVLDTVH